MSASHGQRFRRRAIRRGYKVDEVDVFLDRVEATLNGAGAARITAQDVHDVVFRVRFGGYDEWQVDLHLDRVERQIAEMEERSGGPGVGAQLRAAMNVAPPVDRSGPPPPPLPTRTPSAQMPTSTLPRFDQQQPFDAPRRDENAYAQTGTFAAVPQQEPMRTPSGSYPGFQTDLPRRSEMPGEVRQAPPRDPYGHDSGGFRPVSPAAPFRQPMDNMPGRGFDAAATGAFNPLPPQQNGGFGPPPGGAESQRVDQLRRTFQLRRFGSGYDPGQVDRLFDTVLGALSGRGGVNESELDPSRLSLVPGGYYEAEVDQAIREVREILRSR
jgi:DivIVA domain-containing protein